MKTSEEIIAMFGGVDGLYVSIANEPFMRLVIEHIGEGPHGLPAISVAHYYEMNATGGGSRETSALTIKNLLPHRPPARYNLSQVLAAAVGRFGR